MFLEQPLDQFGFSTTATYRQRYYVFGNHWSGDGGPIFFYVGNEADVGLYVNATGLMWENAPAFRAYLVFAEHRFFGASVPTGSSLSFLSHELALADYAVLIRTVKDSIGAQNSPVIVFGGSYGGKLAAWMRIKYPAIVQGAISASAPLLAFQGSAPAWDSQSYYRVVTNTAKRYSPSCASNVARSMPLIASLALTADGRSTLAAALGLCAVPSAERALDVRFFIRDAFDTLAMGNYPWPSAYIAGSAAEPMPAWPMQHACAPLAVDLADTTLLQAMREAVGVLYNHTKDVPCYELPDYPSAQTPSASIDGQWDWQWCTEQLPDSFWFTTDGVRDMFWRNEYNQSLVDEHCASVWSVRPRVRWIADEYGGRKIGFGASNIVFSSGSFDPWSAGGIATNLSDSLFSIMIESGAHHLDLMFSHPSDPPSVVIARQFQLENIRKWIEQFALLTPAQSWGDMP